MAATVNDDAALNHLARFLVDLHFARATSEASARILDRLAFCIGRRERWLNAGSLKRDPRVLEFLASANLDDFHALRAREGSDMLVDMFGIFPPAPLEGKFDARNYSVFNCRIIRPTSR